MIWSLESLAVPGIFYCLRLASPLHLFILAALLGQKHLSGGGEAEFYKRGLF